MKVEDTAACRSALMEYIRGITRYEETSEL
jgi:hypothetical protein